MEDIEILDGLIEESSKKIPTLTDPAERSREIVNLEKLQQRKLAFEDLYYKSDKDAADRNENADKLKQERELADAKMVLDSNRLALDREKMEREAEAKLAEQEANDAIERERIASNERIKMEEFKSNNIKVAAETGAKIVGGAIFVGSLGTILKFESGNTWSTKLVSVLTNTLCKFIHF